ncbi:hypothetical protein DNTS_006153 [Danionella cerebrum]|uniref:Integrase catalytic domain-containing protein n=1 Tax=Danionella cerebrum TaxID=2873325 RepID=A0A553RHM2_9TELE|nr:hypothetical protein DNTS_006153 [Danionella translucida]
MVMCIVKGCESKSKWYSTVMFHRIPTKRKDRMYRWLAALNIDLNTPIESIKKWRVCSEHFVPDDYQEYTNSISPGQRLKDTAIPNYNTRGSSSSAVQSCEPCQRKSPVTTQRQIPGFPKLKEPWEVLVLDLIGPLPATLRNNNYALVMTDLYTKWVVAEPIQTKTVAEVSAVITAKFYQFGAAREILTDLGQQFVNELNSSLYAALKLKDVVSCAHHPQNAEQDANQTIKHALCTCVSDNHFDWDLQLPAVQFSKKEKTKGSHQIRRQDEKVNTESSAPLNGTEGPASQRTAYVMEKPDMALQCQNEHSYACSPRRYGTIKERLPTIVRDLHTAFYWLQNNRNLLRGDVTEPAFLGMNIDCQQDAIRKLSGDALSDEPDPFLFIFQFQDDMDNFLAWCIDEQGLEVRAMVLKEEEETESVG